MIDCYFYFIFLCSYILLLVMGRFCCYGNFGVVVKRDGCWELRVFNTNLLHLEFREAQRCVCVCFILLASYIILAYLFHLILDNSHLVSHGIISKLKVDTRLMNLNYKNLLKVLLNILKSGLFNLFVL